MAPYPLKLHGQRWYRITTLFLFPDMMHHLCSCVSSHPKAVLIHTPASVCFSGFQRLTKISWIIVLLVFLPHCLTLEREHELPRSQMEVLGEQKKDRFDERFVLPACCCWVNRNMLEESECMQFKDKTFHTSEKHFTVAYTQRMVRDPTNKQKCSAVIQKEMASTWYCTLGALFLKPLFPIN